ncbi:MAG TPA: dTMP kinase [Candidatus Gastranaerophilaceae bacterium]|nr:dTMP kinase [Candidatus Gastranaerophilaceae bacterium]
MEKGLFITFEGADGCGKTTQMNLLHEYLILKGYDVVLTREPGGKGLGERIREILLNYEGEVSSQAEAFLFLADRAQNIDVIVKPAVDAGKIVLCDRHIDSTIAYQGYGRGVNLERLKMLNDIATNKFMPDLTYVFDIDVETSQSRVGKNKDRMESAGVEFFEKVKKGYLELAKKEPERVKVINSANTIENIFAQVKEIFEKTIC